MDLDFAMLLAYPTAYAVAYGAPDADTIKAVLGKSHVGSTPLARTLSSKLTLS